MLPHIKAVSSRFFLGTYLSNEVPRPDAILSWLQLTLSSFGRLFGRMPSRPTENNNGLIQPKYLRTPPLIACAVRSTRRSATKVAVLAAMLFFACCVARSAAQTAIDVHRPIDASKLVDTWHSSGASQNASVVASAQSLLNTTKIDGYSGVSSRVTRPRVVSETRMHRVFVAAAPEVRYTSHLAPGERRTLRDGSPGVVWLTERVTFWNDLVVDRKVMSRELIRDAKPAVELHGTPKTIAQLRAMTSYRSAEVAMTMVATAYTADTASAYPTGYTATGALARQGIVAVDPHVIPLGSTVFVPGYGIAIAADTGGAIVGNRIDLCMDSYYDAVNFGRQTVQVYLLKR
jgi:3D (Asp-Asp-Asp) domain-containing protein